MMKGRQARIALGMLAIFVFVASTVLAQRIDGDLRGVVKDPTGAVVPGATVTITNQNTGVSRETETTSLGGFFAGNLLPGVYTVEVEASGFKRAVKTNVRVIANRVVQVNVELEIGAAVETVTIEAGAELIQTESSTLVGGTFTETTLSSVGAMIGGTGTLTGDVRNLAILAAGTTTQPGGMAGQGGSIGGNRPRNNSFVVDGLDNNDPSVTGQNGPVIAEAIKEFTLLTNQFTAEYGHSTAGHFITTTESGTNEIHGKAWWYNQNRNFNSFDNLTRAVTAQGADKPRYDVNRIGGQAGGAAIKDKLFYFGSFEYQNGTFEGTPSGTILVPTGAGLSTLQALASTPGSGVSPTNVGILADFVPTTSVATGTQQVFDESTGTTVNIPIGQFSASTPSFRRVHLFMLSSDYQTARHRISGRYHYSRQRSIAAGELPIAIFNSNTVFDTQRVTISDVLTIGSNAVNELRVGYNRRTGPDQALESIAAPAGTDVFGNYTLDEMSLSIGPQSNFPQSQAGNTYQIADNFTYITGSHTLKVGGDVRNLLRGGGFLPRERGD